MTRPGAKSVLPYSRRTPYHMESSVVKGFGLLRRVSARRVVRQWGGEMCRVSRAHTLETHARQHIASVCNTFPYMDDNSSRREYAWSV